VTPVTVKLPFFSPILPFIKQNFSILLVEDNPGDVFLFQNGLTELNPAVHISVTTDGDEALRRLRSGERPNLIVLDLNLPKRSGEAVLRELKADVGLRRIPVVIFSSTRNRHEVDAAYDGRANSFISKPADLDAIYDVLRSIEHYWVDLALHPTSCNEPQQSSA